MAKQVKFYCVFLAIYMNVNFAFCYAANNSNDEIDTESYQYMINHCDGSVLLKNNSTDIFRLGRCLEALDNANILSVALKDNLKSCPPSLDTKQLFNLTKEYGELPENNSIKKLPFIYVAISALHEKYPCQ